jgi:hypothetical protein
MKPETGYALLKKIEKDEIFESRSIPPGDFKEIKFLGRGAKIGIISGRDKSSVVIVDPKKRIDAFKSTDSTVTAELKRVNTDSKIEVVGKEMLILVFIKKRYTKGAVIYLCSNGDQHQDVVW